MSLYALHEKSAKHLLEVFPKLKSGEFKQCVDVTITSPPYWNLKNYGFQDQIGYGQTYDQYLEDLERIFNHVHKITKRTGSLWVILDTFKKKEKDHSLDGVKEGELVPLPFDVARRIRRAGWKLQDTMIWMKDKTLPWSRRGQVRNIFEYIFFFSKTDHYKFYMDRIRISDNQKLQKWWVKYPERYNPKGAVPTDIWKYPIPVQGSWASGYLRHFCPFPVEMVERILHLTTNQRNVVLDPFAGSGVVLAVANAMKRRYIGFELNSEYLRMFKEQVLIKIQKEALYYGKRRRQKQRERGKLRRTIYKLRLTKYPKSLVKQLYRYGLLEKQKPSIDTVFAIKRDPTDQQSLSPWKFLKEDVYFILDINTENNLRTHMLEITSRPPLSKFGIEADFYIFSKDTFIEQETQSPSFDHEHLWLYQKGIMNFYHKHINFKKWKNLSSKKQWRELFKNIIPPVVSNVKVRQEVPS